MLRTEIGMLQKRWPVLRWGKQRDHLKFKGRGLNPSWVCKKVSQKLTCELVLGEMRQSEEGFVGQRDEAVCMPRDKSSICTASLHSPCDESTQGLFLPDPSASGGSELEG